MTTIQPGAGALDQPTVLRLLVGAQLRELREAAGVSRAEAGYEIRASESKISRMELGRVALKERDVADLLTLYGVTSPAEREPLLSRVRQANQAGWWGGYLDVMPRWFQSYLGLEAAAALVRTYEVQFVPGLLQTRDYARAVVALGHDSADEAEIERRVDLRMERQSMLARGDLTRVWAVVDEAAIRRPVGGTAVMRSQLRALVDACNQPSIRLQVVPFGAGGHAAAGGAFTILQFSEPDLSDIVYIEHLTSALYLDSRADVDGYTAAMDRLCAQAVPPNGTAEVLNGIMRDLEEGSGRGSYTGN